MFENSPIIKDHSRPAVKLAASGIFVGLCEIIGLYYIAALYTSPIFLDLLAAGVCNIKEEEMFNIILLIYSSRFLYYASLIFLIFIL